jgi:hypothetical protein
VGLTLHVETTGRQADMTGVDAVATFDFAAFFAAVDDARRDRDMGWYDLAGELWEQSAQLNAERGDHPLCGGAVSRLGARGEASCQYALYLLRWLGRAPEEFLTGRLLTSKTCGFPTRAQTAGSALTSASSMPRSTPSGSGRG